MAYQKVCKQGIGMMHESKGQHIGKAPSLEPDEGPTTLRTSLCEADFLISCHMHD